MVKLCKIYEINRGFVLRKEERKKSVINGIM